MTSDRISFGGCPLCDSKNHSTQIVANCSNYPHYDKRLSPEIVWKVCKDCNHSFTEGYYTDASSEILFSKIHTTQKVGAELEKNRLVSSKMVDRVLPYASSGLWLDVGFGNGSLLFTAQEYGFHVAGLDLRKESVDALNSVGIKAFAKSITEINIRPLCSVISMMDVLEHIPYPKEALIAANKLLADGGVLFLSMPNTESIVWRMLTQNNANPYWAEMEHYHNFSRTRLYALLEEFGFKAKQYAISDRYRCCMEVIAVKERSLTVKP